MTNRFSARWRMVAIVVAAGAALSACTGGNPAPTDQTTSPSTPQPTSTPPTSPPAKDDPTATSREVCLHHEGLCFDVPKTWKALPGDVENQATQDYMTLVGEVFKIEIRTGLPSQPAPGCSPNQGTQVTAMERTGLTIPRRDERGGGISVAQFTTEMGGGTTELRAQMVAGRWITGKGANYTCEAERTAPIFSPKRESLMMSAGILPEVRPDTATMRKVMEIPELQEAMKILKSAHYK